MVTFRNDISFGPVIAKSLGSVGMATRDTQVMTEFPYGIQTALAGVASGLTHP